MASREEFGGSAEIPAHPRALPARRADEEGMDLADIPVEFFGGRYARVRDPRRRFVLLSLLFLSVTVATGVSVSAAMAGG